MKMNFLLLLAVISLSTFCVSGQGTIYVYDQQSSTNETPFPGSGGAMQQIIPPWGQSFTPTLSSINFIRLKFSDGNVSDGLGATIYLNLRSGSITGTIVDSTTPVTMPNNFAGTTTFLFPSAQSLIPGTTYYFEPILQSGGTWNIDSGEYNYPGGSGFYNGMPQGATDLWFREGIIVPEPSSVALMLLAGGIWLSSRRTRHA